MNLLTKLTYSSWFSSSKDQTWGIAFNFYNTTYKSLRAQENVRLFISYLKRKRKMRDRLKIRTFITIPINFILLLRFTD